MKTKELFDIRVVTIAAALLSAGVGIVSPSSLADGLPYATGFERPVFVVGKLDAQDGWQNPLSSASISVVRPDTGRQAIQVLGAKLGPLGPGLVGTRFGRLFPFDAAGMVIDVGVDTKLEGPITNDNDLVSANLDILFADSSMTPIYIGTVYLSSSGDIWAFDVDGAFAGKVSVDDINVYHRLGARLNFAERTIEFFADSESFGWGSMGADTGSYFAIGALSVFAVDNRELVKPNKYRTRFDNYCLTSDQNCAQ